MVNLFELECENMEELHSAWWCQSHMEETELGSVVCDLIWRLQLIWTFPSLFFNLSRQAGKVRHARLGKTDRDIIINFWSEIFYPPRSFSWNTIFSQNDQQHKFTRDELSGLQQFIQPRLYIFNYKYNKNCNAVKYFLHLKNNCFLF